MASGIGVKSYPARFQLVAELCAVGYTVAHSIKEVGPQKQEHELCTRYGKAVEVN